MDPKYNEQGLVPAIAQDSRTGEVLMLAWMNAEAWQKTLETRDAYFWSRERKTLWRKGETSGNTMKVEEVRLDCDADAVLLKVIPAGPACHTSERSCFFNHVTGEANNSFPAGFPAPSRDGHRRPQGQSGGRILHQRSFPRRDQ